jgi:hypothetical protein
MLQLSRAIKQTRSLKAALQQPPPRAGQTQPPIVLPALPLPAMTAQHVLEVFARDGNKRSALEYVAGGMGIPLARCVAMGDQINDLPMIGGVGLGIAMGNAVEQVRQIARKATLRNDEHGVAHAIGQVLCGAW